MSLDLLKRFQTVSGGDYVVTLSLQAPTYDLDVIGHVVDDQDKRALAHDLLLLHSAVHRKTLPTMAGRCRGLTGLDTHLSVPAARLGFVIA
jgi:hypothetical protein